MREPEGPAIFHHPAGSNVLSFGSDASAIAKSFASGQLGGNLALMQFRLTPLTGRPAAFWASAWFFAATLLTLSLWRPVLHLLPFTVYFAAMAIIAARSGAWYGLGSIIGSVAVVAPMIDAAPGTIVIRCVGMLANSALIIWLGARLRRGVTEENAFRASIDEAVSDFVWSCDPAIRPISANARALEFLGVTGEELSLRGWDFFVHPEDRAELEKAFTDGRSSLAPAEVEARLRRHDGTFHWFTSRIVPIMDADGTLERWIGTSTNIDARKRIEFEREELLASERKARSEAEHASRMKDEFLATLSHELRTPLSAITGWLHLLKGGEVEPEELAEGLEVIARNTRVQTQLIEDLLDMNRIITGKVRLDVQTMQIPQVIEAALASIRPSAEAKSIRVKSILDPRAATVRGDPARLQQIIWNLLSNSVKFTPKGGQIEVILERIESHAEINVSDSGSGIAPEFLPHIFERFRQADATTTRPHGGLGLGLAIARQLVELHGGTIAATSAGVGRGSTFRVILPLPAAQIPEPPGPARIHPHSSAAATAHVAAAQLAGVRVLVVDDEQDSREVVRRILKDCGAEVTTAASAGEALKALRADGFSVLVSDIGMPVMDGFEFVRQLRASDLPSARTLPAIALTAFARSEDRRRAMQSGFDMFVSKPVDAPELTAVVERCAVRAEGGA